MVGPPSDQPAQPDAIPRELLMALGLATFEVMRVEEAAAHLLAEAKKEDVDRARQSIQSDSPMALTHLAEYWSAGRKSHVTDAIASFVTARRQYRSQVGRSVADAVPHVLDEVAREAKESRALFEECRKLLQASRDAEKAPTGTSGENDHPRDPAEHSTDPRETA
jgi:hypothetical protein